jgi:hypothetical protein
MLRFAVGVVVGVFIAKPTNDLIQKHLTPPVRQKIKKVVNDLAVRLNDSIDSTEETK